MLIYFRILQGVWEGGCYENIKENKKAALGCIAVPVHVSVFICFCEYGLYNG